MEKYFVGSNDGLGHKGKFIYSLNGKLAYY